MRAFHRDDPAARDLHLWHFCYAHAAAERLCDERLTEWFDPDELPAGDLLAFDEPMPSQPGEYPGTLYGRPCVAVLAHRHGDRTWLSGRLALLDDPVGLAHARTPEDWR